MKATRSSQQPAGFTRADLLAAVATAGLLAVWLVSVSATSRAKSEATTCAAHLRELQRAMALYAADHQEQFSYNMGIAEMLDARARRLNWTPNIATWDSAPGNTNQAWAREATLARYLTDPVGSFKCPANRFLSQMQVRLRWQARLRSYSMNGFFGIYSTSPASGDGRNPFFPQRRQFLRTTDPRNPAGMFVFIEEHPDSINDGYFINNPDGTSWGDIPASFHDRAVNLTFADGHLETHRWQSARLALPVRFTYVPVSSDAAARADYRWLMDRTCER